MKYKVADIYGYYVAIGTAFQPPIVMISQAHLGLCNVMLVHLLLAGSLLAIRND
jgi:hypothetical protein